MIAVIKTGGKQYIVSEGQAVKVEKLEGKTGDNVEFSEILMVSNEDGKDAKVGTPVLEGAKVTGKIVEQGRDKKVTVVKYKAKTRYKRTKGHRQHFTKVEIEKIAA